MIKNCKKSTRCSIEMSTHRNSLKAQCKVIPNFWRRLGILLRIAKVLLMYSLAFCTRAFTSPTNGDPISSSPSKHVSWSVIEALIHVCMSFTFLSVKAFSPGPTWSNSADWLSWLSASSNKLTQSFNADTVPGSLTFEISDFGSEETLVNSLIVAWRERFRNGSGSGFCGLLWREDMESKHDSGYWVTAHTALSKSAELDDTDGVRSLEFDAWINAPTNAQMSRVRKRVRERAMARRRLWAALRVDKEEAGSSERLILP